MQCRKFAISWFSISGMAVYSGATMTHAESKRDKREATRQELQIQAVGFTGNRLYVLNG